MSTGRGQILKNSVWNILGQVVPAAVGLVTIPILIRSLGNERFALITLVWLITGYLGIFDFGLGKALTQAVAEKLGLGRLGEIPALIGSVTTVMILFGFFASCAFWWVTPYALNHWLSVPVELIPEARQAALWVALTIPFVIAGTGLRGVLEASHRFDIVTILKMPLASGLFLIPAIVASLTHALPSVVCAIFAIRALGFWAHAVACVREYPGLKFSFIYNHKLVRPLYKFGLWMTVSNVISPIMAQMDRFYVGAVLSLAAVAFYATPYELVNRAYALPLAIAGVLFPTMTKSYASDFEKWKGSAWPESKPLYLTSFKILGFAVFPLMALLALFSYEILEVWLGHDYAEKGSRVLQILTFGICFNAMANVPYNFLQAAGRADLSAKIHIFELPLFIFFLRSMTQSFGIEGTAWTWTLRVTLDMFLMIFATQWKVMAISELRSPAYWSLRLGALFLIAVLIYFAGEYLTFEYKMVFAVLGLGLLAWVSYNYGLSRNEKENIIMKLKKWRSL